MKNKKFLTIGLEGKSLFYPMDSHGIYTYNLIKHLSIIERIHKFYVYFNHAPIFKKNIIDFKQHNLILKRYSIMPSSPKFIDVYHDTCFCFSNIKTNAKKILSINSIAPLTLPGLYTKSDHIFFKRNIDNFAGNFDFIIAPNNGTKNDIAANLKIIPAKIHVIPMGAREYFSKSTKYQIELSLARYSLKRPYILFVGSLEDRKNIYNLLCAYAKLKYESPPQLVIAGMQKWMNVPLKNMISKLGLENDVKYLGYIPNCLLPPIYSGAELLLYPSLNVGYGFSLLEAFACETPVITSDIASVQEITAGAAILTDPNNVSKIAASLKEALANDSLRDDLRRKGIKRTADFSMKSCALQTLELYKRAALK